MTLLVKASVGHIGPLLLVCLLAGGERDRCLARLPFFFFYDFASDLLCH